jgi:H+/Cl- antiporter ClcA
VNSDHDDPHQPTQSAVLKLLLVAIIVGMLAAAASSIFVEVVAAGQKLLFEQLPKTLGIATGQWWWAAVVLLVGACLVTLARLMPGRTGKGPLTGFHFDDPLGIVPSVLVAALATLVFGFALGPEAPLIVLGTAVGAILTRNRDTSARKAAMFLGGAAAIGAVFGNPFVTGFMILELIALGQVPVVLLAPVFVALASGYLTQLGILNLPGFGVHNLAVPGLPDYTVIAPGDVLMGLIVAVVASLVAIVARLGGLAFDAFARRRAVVALVGGAVVTAAALGVAQLGFGAPQSQVLFSGNSGMGDLVKQSSVSVVAVILVCKLIAYAAALGSGFRGGPIFPATFLGVAAGVLTALVIPAAPLSAMVAAGIAASAAAMLKLPATSALLAALLVAGTSPAIAPFAIFGAVIGWLVRVAHDSRTPWPSDAAGSASTQPA